MKRLLILCAGLSAVCGPVWAESLSGGNSLFSSERTYQPGDLVTVIISESAQGEQSASTDLHKDTSVGLTTGGAIGTLLPSANLGIDSKQQGGGNLAREGKMTATLTARVEKILPNGCLSLCGEQELAFDSGRQRISITGMARPRDISAANEIYSYRLSNAKIEFLGQDALGEKARTGFISRILEWLWIF